MRGGTTPPLLLACTAALLWAAGSAQAAAPAPGSGACKQALPDKVAARLLIQEPNDMLQELGQARWQEACVAAARRLGGYGRGRAQPAQSQ